MAISKGKKKVKETQDMEAIKSDVASFASSIGLASSATASNPSSGFDDSDFRKTGTIKNPQNPDSNKKKKIQNPKSSNEETKKPQKENFEKGKKQLNPKKGFSEENKKPQNGKFEKKKYENNNKNDRIVKEKVTPVSIDNSKPLNNKWKNLPKLPCIRATSLRVWYEDAAELESKIIGNEAKKIEAKNEVEWKNLVAKKREVGERLMAQFTEDFETSKGNSGDIKMLLATQRSGTAVDKVSAFSVLVGENPIANIRSLDALLAMVTSKVGKRHALTGFEALKELFLSSLLPDRKLKILPQHPLNHLTETKDGYSLLLFWYWEECLKQRYERFVFALEEASRDMLPVLKEKALKTIYALLRSKSEQERRLLSGLVNKLGDPENKGASNADYHLSNLLTEHPNMTAVVIDEVDSFLFRPHLGPRSKYHAVNFLCQIRLTHKGDGAKVAKRLVDVYFALFKLLISESSAEKKLDKGNKKEDKKETGSLKNNKAENPSGPNVEMDSRLLSALLTGVNRAFPFVASDEADDVVEVQTPMLFKLVHSINFNVGVQALLLLEKISSKNQIVSDRFYRALYSKLLLPSAMNSSKGEMFIGLLLRAMKSDVNLKRVSAFSKRILQVALQQPPQFACGCLFLLSEVLKARPPLWNMVLQSESLDDDDVEHFEDIVEETENKSEPALLKQPESAVTVVPNNNDVAKIDPDSSDSEEVDLSGSDFESEDNDSDGDDILKRGSNTVGQLKTDGSSGGTQPPNVKLSLPGGYDPRHREPSYCNADRASWWELMVLASHAHPSVATMARTLLSGTNIVYNGNPLTDLALPAFLDKLMEKKPKSSTWHGGSQIEPAKKLGTNNLLIGAEILSLDEEDVAPEDLVFHKFYTNKMNSSKKPKKKKKKVAEDEATEELLGFDRGDGSEDDIGGDDDGGEDEIGGDESDNEEIDNLLDSGDLPLDEAAGDYDYDDLDQVAEEDDEDLIGGSGDDDAEMDILSDVADEDDDDADLPVNIGDSDDDINEEEDDMVHNKRKRNRKGGRKAGASPFASIEDYDHLLKDENDPSKDSSTKAKKKSSSRKKRKLSD
ncbi:hypothetical protein C5167_001718 [Papaver somniferum]|uniref:CCAAT-binding factor domain-containing protein n=1 Tax=Papaver somniferum TaxID=3469 RepID=A0A4Y7L014_PAPSO|nr:uncharacterized protein C4F10.09c-like [Papaver somniferum]RZC77535.1 hypothetical protein C5167_001718 [Papaver somniferum]